MRSRGSWLIGETAAGRIDLISKTFFASSLSNFNRKSSKPDYFYDRYQPWMSSPSLVEEVTLQSVEPPTSMSGRIVTSNESLTKLSLMIASSKRTDILPKMYQNRIFNDWQDYYPELPATFERAVTDLRRCSWIYSIYRSLVLNLVPLTSRANAASSNSACSDFNLLGAVLFGLKVKSNFQRVDLALSLAHETGHQALMLYQRTSAVIENYRQTVYSGVRKTKRPAILALQACMALAYMIEMSISLEKSKDFDRKEIAYLKQQRQQYTSQLKASLFDFRNEKIIFTGLGRILISELSIYSSLPEAV